jgi:hypothetical protein
LFYNNKYLLKITIELYKGFCELARQENTPEIELVLKTPAGEMKEKYSSNFQFWAILYSLATYNNIPMNIALYKEKSGIPVDLGESISPGIYNVCDQQDCEYTTILFPGDIRDVRDDLKNDKTASDNRRN